MFIFVIFLSSCAVLQGYSKWALKGGVGVSIWKLGVMKVRKSLLFAQEWQSRFFMHEGGIGREVLAFHIDPLPCEHPFKNFIPFWSVLMWTGTESNNWTPNMAKWWALAQAYLVNKVVVRIGINFLPLFSKTDLWHNRPWMQSFSGIHFEMGWLLYLGVQARVLRWCVPNQILLGLA